MEDEAAFYGAEETAGGKSKVGNPNCRFYTKTAVGLSFGLIGPLINRSRPYNTPAVVNLFTIVGVLIGPLR